MCYIWARFIGSQMTLKNAHKNLQNIWKQSVDLHSFDKRVVKLNLEEVEEPHAHSS